MRKLLTRRSVSLFVALLFCFFWLVPAHATPITFTFTGVGSGFLDNNSTITPFTEAAFTIVIPADTSNVDHDFGINIPGIHNLSGTIALTGFTTTSFTDALYVFDEQVLQQVGFGAYGHGDLISITVSSAGLDTYALDSSFGPITTSTPYFLQFQMVGLGIGDLTFTSMDYATFSASTVPLPPSALLLGSGLLGLAGWRRFRKN